MNGPLPCPTAAPAAAAAANASIQSVLIDPPANTWGAWLRKREPTPRARRFREQLGLATGSSPVIMTGHQADFWHPGILAKYLAADAAARKWGAQTSWVIVDQDANDFARIRYPVRTPHGRFAARSWVLTRSAVAGPAGDPLPTASARAFTPEPLPALNTGDRFAADSVEPGLRAIRDALLEHTRAASAAEQIRLALDDLLAPHIAPAPSAFATHFARTDLFRDIVARMRDDPAACVRAYNVAVAAHPHARMATLALNDTQYIYELPLWRIDPAAGGQRRRVYAEDIAEIPLQELAPRAALMTGLLRMAACELFIAGTGGGGEHGYERVAEQWLRDWLGEPLAPEAVVTATVHLDMGADPVSDADVTGALWRAHHARHDPAMLGDEPAAREKMALVRRIAEKRERGEDPTGDYRQMHRLLERTRDQRRGKLDAFDTEAARMLARRHDADTIADRTWAFPLYDPHTLTMLKEQINGAFK